MHMRALVANFDLDMLWLWDGFCQHDCDVKGKMKALENIHGCPPRYWKYSCQDIGMGPHKQETISLACSAYWYLRERGILDLKRHLKDQIRRPHCRDPRHLISHSVMSPTLGHRSPRISSLPFEWTIVSTMGVCARGPPYINWGRNLKCSDLRKICPRAHQWTDSRWIQPRHVQEGHKILQILVWHRWNVAFVLLLFVSWVNQPAQ